MNHAVTYEPVGFGALKGWADDDHAAALVAFVRSLKALETHSDCSVLAGRLLDECRNGARILNSPDFSSSMARGFFEQCFLPHSVSHAAADGLFTGYFEPILSAARVATAEFPIPLLRRPADLVTLVDDALRGSEGITFTHARQTDHGVEPYFTRQEIECGSLGDAGLEFAYLADPVDAYFLHIQGSGLLEFADGSRVRVGYDGKNGHPYSSVGQYVIGLGEMSSSEMTLDSLKQWLRADPERGRRAMWENRSYIFFRELGAETNTATLGAREIPLTPGRSLAVDAGKHELGLPIFVRVPDLRHTGMPAGFQRLMVAQDVGSAIRGPERADIFYGTGDEAGRHAGTTKHRGNFFVLLPRSFEGHAAG
jgi:membrane-bound lytic murein transglycosylase A